MLVAVARSWGDLQRFENDLDVGGPYTAPYLFRGQADMSWPLIPSFLRTDGGTQLSEADALQIEKHAIAHFKSAAHLHVPQEILTTTTDIVSWWTLMQHHGAYTRVLDWTQSFYVAAYFAVISNFSKAGSIWCVHTGSVVERMNARYGEEASFPTDASRLEAKLLTPGAPPTLIFCRRLSHTDRMFAQQGAFSLSHSVLGHHGEILDSIFPANETERVLYAQIIIPCDLKRAVLSKLQKMNITAASLFPGLDGVAKSAAEQRAMFTPPQP